MAFTMQQIVDRGRRPLNDDSKVRMSDVTGLGYGIDGILLLRNKRPDLFVGKLTTDFSVLVLGSSFPLDDEFMPAVADYITARAETVDDESILQERAVTFFRFAEGQL